MESKLTREKFEKRYMVSLEEFEKEYDIKTESALKILKNFLSYLKVNFDFHCDETKNNPEDVINNFIFLYIRNSTLITKESETDARKSSLYRNTYPFCASCGEMYPYHYRGACGDIKNE